MGKYRNADGASHRRVPSEHSVIISAPAFAVVSPLLIVGNDEAPAGNYGNGGISSRDNQQQQQRVDNNRATAEEPAYEEDGYYNSTATMLGCRGSPNEATITACVGNEGSGEYYDGNPGPKLDGAGSSSSSTAGKRATREAPRWCDNGSPADDGNNTATMLRDYRRHVSCKSAGFVGGAGRGRSGRSRPAAKYDDVADSASQRKVCALRWFM